MADFYGRLAGTAARVLSRYGQGKVELVRVTQAPGETSYEPGPDKEVRHTLKAVARGVAQKFVDGTTVLASDLQIVAAVPGIEPALSDRIEIDGKATTLVRIDRIPAAGTAVAFRFIVRC